eukprot:GFYU01002513.1.p1 GENE.GFYU01002513.1~~GFYU01002513.1.p1  ORF type:complete len:1889 (-),score=605.82 GFYU01002513.1:48-5714(-)
MQSRSTSLVFVLAFALVAVASAQTDFGLTVATAGDLKFVNFGGTLYATLDGGDPLSFIEGCHGSNNFLPVPAGWKVADPAEDNGRAHLAIQGALWGTHQIVLSDGKAYETRELGAPVDNASDHLVLQGSNYSVKTCNSRILLSKPAVTDNEKKMDAMAAEEITNFFRWGSKVYATLDNADVNPVQTHHPGCQLPMKNIPNGWLLAPDVDETIYAIMGPGHAFNTECLVMSNGKSYFASTVKDCNSNQLEQKQVGPTTKIYGPRKCHQRVLIYRPYNEDTEDIDDAWYSSPIVYNRVSIGALRFATIDNAHPAGNAVGCQGQGYIIPHGWEIATKEQLLTGINSLEFPFSFETNCLVTKTGESIYPADGSNCGTDQLVNRGLYYAPASCSQRIAIVQQANVALPEKPDLPNAPFDYWEQASCELWGFSNVITFDELEYTSYRTGEFYAIKAGAQDYLEVAARYELVPSGSNDASYLSAISIALGDKHNNNAENGQTSNDRIALYTRFVESDGTIVSPAVMHNGQHVTLDVGASITTDHDKVTITRLEGDHDSYVLTKGSIGRIHVTFMRRKGVVYMAATISIPRQYASGSKGLCGNFNGFPRDDLHMLYAEDPVDPTVQTGIDGTFMPGVATVDSQKLFDYAGPGRSFSDFAGNKVTAPNYSQSFTPQQVSSGFAATITSMCDAVADGRFSTAPCVRDVVKTESSQLIELFRIAVGKSLASEPDMAHCLFFGLGHIETFDQSRYTFHADGDRVMISNTRDDLAVWLRMAPSPLAQDRAGKDKATFATGVAVQREGNTFTVLWNPTDNTVQVLVNGAETNVVNEYRHTSLGTSITKVDEGVDVVYTIEEKGYYKIRAVVESGEKYGLTVAVNLNRKYTGRTYGFCGDMQGKVDPSSNSPENAGKSADEYVAYLNDQSNRTYPTSIIANPKAFAQYENPDYTIPSLGERVDREIHDKCEGVSHVDFYVESCRYDASVTTKIQESLQTSSRATAERDLSIFNYTPTCSGSAAITNTVVHLGRTYALLDNTSAREIKLGCQSTSYQIPDGWRIAPNSPTSRSLLALYTWGTGCVVLSDGTSWTPGFGLCNVRQLRYQGNNGGCIGVRTCDQRVLIIKEEAPAFTVSNGSFNDGISGGWVVPSKDEVTQMLSDITLEAGTDYRTHVANDYSWTEVTPEAWGVSTSSESYDGKSASASLRTKTQMVALKQSIPKATSDNVYNKGGAFRVCAKVKTQNLRSSFNVSNDFGAALIIHANWNKDVKGKKYDHEPFPLGTTNHFSELCAEFNFVDLVNDVGAILNSIDIYLIAGPGYEGIMFVDDVYATHASGNVLSNGEVEAGPSISAPTLMWEPLHNGYTVEQGQSENSIGSQAVKITHGDDSQLSGGKQTIHSLHKYLDNAYANVANAPAYYLHISGYSKAQDVSGTPSEGYSLYVDVIYSDGTGLRGQFLPFSTGTHGWEYKDLYLTLEKSVATIEFAFLFRRHSGTVWFDDLSVVLSTGQTRADVKTHVPVVSGGVFGDPHVVTHDNQLYQFQALGQYLLTKDSMLLAQISTENTKTDYGTILSGVAFSYGHQSTNPFRLTVQKNEARPTAEPQLRVNGVLFAVGNKASTLYGTDGTAIALVSRSGEIKTGYAMTLKIRFFISGHGCDVIARAGASVGQYLQINMIMPRTSRSSTIGLLGNFDGVKTNDGTEDPDTLMKTWLVADTTSLFDTAPASLHEHRNPDTVASLRKEIKYENGQLSDPAFKENWNACSRLNVYDDVLMACALDLFYTGDQTLAEGYHTVQSNYGLKEKSMLEINNGASAQSPGEEEGGVEGWVVAVVIIVIVVSIVLAIVGTKLVKKYRQGGFQLPKVGGQQEKPVTEDQAVPQASSGMVNLDTQRPNIFEKKTMYDQI